MVNRRLIELLQKCSARQQRHQEETSYLVYYAPLRKGTNHPND
jgi:hypothetical protein